MVWTLRRSWKTCFLYKQGCTFTSCPTNHCLKKPSRLPPISRKTRAQRFRPTKPPPGLGRHLRFGWTPPSGAVRASKHAFRRVSSGGGSLSSTQKRNHQPCWACWAVFVVFSSFFTSAKHLETLPPVLSKCED